MNLDRYQQLFPTLRFEQPSEGILEIILDTQTPMNPMSSAMHRDCAYVWREIDMDEDVRVALIRGEGKGFSAGGDFELVNGMINDDKALLRGWKECRDMVYNLINCSKPVVSAIHGAAVGAGLAVALLADIAIATKKTRLIDSHTKLGVAAGDFSVIALPILCGMAKAKYHLMTGKPILGEDAERMGLIALCTEEDELYDTALNTAKELLQGSPSAISWTKHALNNWLRMMGPSFDNSLALEMLGFRMPDIREGLAAMQEKRPPQFDQNCPL